MPKKDPRKEFNPYKEAIKLFSTLNEEQLSDRDLLDDLLLKHKIDIRPTIAGKARAEALRQRNGEKSGSGEFKDLETVSKAAKQVGGLENLKKIVNLLEKLKGI